MKPLDELAGGVGFILLIAGAFLALHLGPAHSQPYASLSIGRSSSPEFFGTAARYAFPDLATGGGDCCVLTHSTANQGDGFRLALPVMQGKGKPLVFRAWAPGDAMDSGVWSIPEPKGDKPALDPDEWDRILDEKYGKDARGA